MHQGFGPCGGGAHSPGAWILALHPSDGDFDIYEFGRSRAAHIKAFRDNVSGGTILQEWFQACIAICRQFECESLGRRNRSVQIGRKLRGNDMAGFASGEERILSGSVVG